MSSEIKKRKYQGPVEEKFDVKAIILPFSLIPGKKEEYIYTDGEKIPFIFIIFLISLKFFNDESHF